VLSKRAGALHHPQPFLNAIADLRSAPVALRDDCATMALPPVSSSTPERDPEVWLLISEKIALH
jgi:hypothetical protein